jgi:hypothetical protein
VAVGDTNLAKCTWTISISSTLNKELDLNTPIDPLSISDAMSLTDGSGAANTGNQQWHDTRTLTTGADETLDLNGGLSNAFGDTATFGVIRGLYIKNPSTVNTLIVGDAASDVFSPMFGADDHTRVLQPLETMYIPSPSATGLAVNSTNKNLKIEHGGQDSSSTSYDIVLVGEEE